jgi:hypothetical protein
MMSILAVALKGPLPYGKGPFFDNNSHATSKIIVWAWLQCIFICVMIILLMSRKINLRLNEKMVK